MSLCRSPAFQGVIVQIVCVVEIEFDACALTTCHAKYHTSAFYEEEDFNIFHCISTVQTQGNLGRIHIGPWSRYLNKLYVGPHAADLSSSGDKNLKVYFTLNPGSSWIRPF